VHDAHLDNDEHVAKVGTRDRGITWIVMVRLRGKGAPSPRFRIAAIPIGDVETVES